jgi:DUF4097 and DUF4098 domain-containing protein YvlB
MRAAAMFALSFLAVPVSGDWCRHTAPHRLTAATAGATAIVVIGHAGSLRVTGAAVSAVEAKGTACASDEDFLKQMRIEARRDGSEVKIEAIIPEHKGFFFDQASLDLEITVPENIPVRVVDGSGEVEIEKVAALDITDGAGSVNISDVRGDVKLRDGSGSVEVERIGGSVTVTEDGSGSLDIRGVSGDVTIQNDGSGSIDVGDVRGNFTVLRDGSGGVEYSRVSGTVRIPSKD